MLAYFLELYSSRTRVAMVACLLVAPVPLSVAASPQERDLREASEPGAEAVDASRRDGLEASVRLYGGWRQLWGGDVNEAVANFTQSVISGRELVPLRDGDAPATRRGVEYGATLTVPLTSSFGLVGGVGWIESDSAGRVIEVPASTVGYPFRYSSSLELRSVPVWAGVQYTHPLSRRLRLLVDGGAGLYFTRLRSLQRLETGITEPTSTTFESLWDVRGYDLGFRGGVSVEVGLSNRMGVIVGVQGVHANIGGLEGSRERTLSGGFDAPPMVREGTLSVFRFDDNPIFLGFIEEFLEQEELWVGAYGPLRDSREARAGLGGLRYAGGLRVALGGSADPARRAGSSVDARTSRLDARVYGGWRQLWGGDVNEAVGNTSRFTVSSLYEFEEFVALEDVDAPAVRSGGEYGADVVLRLTPRLGIVSGLGWIASSSAGRMIETPRSTALYPSRSSAGLELRSVAVRVGAQYAHPLGRRLQLLVDGGAGLYFTRLQWSQWVRVDFLGGTTSDLLTDVRGYDLGFHGGVSLDVSLSDRMGLVVGVQGVRADVAGLEGFREATYTGFSFREGRVVTRSEREDVTLGILEFNDVPEFSPLLGLVEDEALWVERYGPVIRSVEEARAGLGGLRYTGGLRVSF